MSLSVVLSGVMAFGVSITSAGSLYMGRKESVNWQTAKERCACFGGQLATWSNDNDYNAIKSVRSQLGNNAWVGFHDLDAERSWKMIDGATDFCAPHTNTGTDCDDIDEWQPGEPNDYGSGEDCAELYSNGKLNDLFCTWSRYYICEFSDGNFKTASSDLEIPNLPWIRPAPRHFVFGTYSAQDLMVVALAVFGVINVVTLSVFCLRTKGAATVRYAKVVADSDEDCRLNA